MVSCPKCHRIIIDTTPSGGHKLRSRMVLFLDGKAVALCPSCKTYVNVPLILGEMPSSLPKEKIIISK